MSHFKAKMHQIRFLVSVRLFVRLLDCLLDGVWHYIWHGGSQYNGA